MNTSTWICYLMPIVLFFILYICNRNKKKKVKQHIKSKKGFQNDMNEVIDKFMNKGVCVTTIDDSDTGRLIAFNDGWITISEKGEDKCINTEYIVKIEGYTLPEDKKKNKKAKN